MSWKSFLARLRYFFFFRRSRARRRCAVKRLPDRRKRVFDWEPFESRAHMEPPVTSLAATAAGMGLGVYAVNMAIANAQADYAPRAPEAALSNQGTADALLLSSAVGETSIPDTAVPDRADGAYAGALAYLGAEPDSPPLDGPAIEAAFNPTSVHPSAVGGDPFPQAPSSGGGGGGAESGGLARPSGGSASIPPGGQVANGGAADGFSPGGLSTARPSQPALPTSNPAGDLLNPVLLGGARLPTLGHPPVGHKPPSSGGGGVTPLDGPLHFIGDQNLYYREPALSNTMGTPIDPGFAPYPAGAGTTIDPAFAVNPAGDDPLFATVDLGCPYS